MPSGGLKQVGKARARAILAKGQGVLLPGAAFLDIFAFPKMRQPYSGQG